MEDINLKQAIKTDEFRNYWAYQERSFWPLNAWKRVMVFCFDDLTIYAKFNIKVIGDDELGQMVRVYCNDEDITYELELDPFNCNSLEIAKSCAYYFYSRF